MPIAKPIYKMTIDLATFRTDALKDTLDRIRELTSDAEKTAQGEIKIKVSVEGDNLAGLQAIRNQLEIYLRQQKNGLVSGTVDIKEPLVRPAPEPTPMDEAFDDLLGDELDSITFSHGDRSATITRETARNAAAMLRGE